MQWSLLLSDPIPSTIISSHLSQNQCRPWSVDDAKNSYILSFRPRHCAHFHTSSEHISHWSAFTSASTASPRSMQPGKDSRMVDDFLAFLDCTLFHFSTGGTDRVDWVEDALTVVGFAGRLAFTIIWTWPVGWEMITEVILRCVVPSAQVTVGLTPILGYICRTLVVGRMDVYGLGTSWDDCCWQGLINSFFAKVTVWRHRYRYVVTV